MFEQWILSHIWGKKSYVCDLKIVMMLFPPHMLIPSEVKKCKIFGEDSFPIQKRFIIHINVLLSVYKTFVVDHIFFVFI